MTIQEKLQALYPKGVELGYVDYNDNRNENKEIIQKIVEGDMDFVYEKVDERYRDGEYLYIEEIIKEVEATEEEEDEVREWCYENNTFNPMKQLLKNTSAIRVRIMRDSNYEALYRGDKTDEYKKQIVKELKGKVLKKDIEKEENSLCGGDYGKFCFYGEMELGEFLKERNGKIKIHKGTGFGFVNTWNGYCSELEAVTTKDFVIDLNKIGDSKYDKWSLEIDSEDGYGIDQICGMTTNFWEKGGIELL